MEVRYGGVVVGRSPQVRDRTDAGAFIVFSEPLPVGTSLTLKIDEREQPAYVTEVVESADASAAGMRVRFGSAPAVKSAPAARPPERVAAPAPAAAAAPAPVSAPRAEPAAAPAPVAAPRPEPAAPAPAPAPAAVVATPASEAASSPVPVPVGGEGSTGSTGVPAGGDASAQHGADPNAHHERRKRRRK